MTRAPSAGDRPPDARARSARRTRWAAALILAAALAAHVRYAQLRARGLLWHDEAISLLAAAGRSDDLHRLALRSDEIIALPAARLQSFLRADSNATARDVLHALARHDIHPPFYFLLLNGVQRLGLHANAPLRLLGSLALFAAAALAWRCVWRDAPGSARLLGLAWLLLTPASLSIATELRQYPWVQLGLVATFAAWAGTMHPDSGRRSLLLAGAAAGLLLWCHYGSIVWLACFAPALLIATRVGARPAARQGWASAAVLFALLVIPLAAWTLTGRAAPSAVVEPIGEGLTIAGAAVALLRGAAEAWWTVPSHWSGGMLPPLLAAASILLMSVIIALRKTADRIVFGAILAWSIAWTALLAAGRIPAHAASAKQIAPLALGLLLLGVRACGDGPAWRRRIAPVALALPLLPLAWGTLSLLRGSPPTPAQTCLASADALLVRTPKRGHVLPLIDALRPGARVILAEPDVALRDLDHLRSLLPPGRLAWVEVDARPGGQRGENARTLFDRLRNEYVDCREVASGPSRIITEFHHRAPRGTRAAESD